MSCGNGKGIKHCWTHFGMEFVYGAKVMGNAEEMELLVEVARKHNVSMIYTAETFNDCGNTELRAGVYGVWFQENHPETTEEAIEAMWKEFQTEKNILLTGWHDFKEVC